MVHFVMDAVDAFDLKLRSSATLFSAVSKPDSVFTRIIDQYFHGNPDQKTLDLLESP